MSRWIRFLFVIVLGAALGLFYGWRINPLRSAETDPETLRVDYQTDYVLMVAEAYSQEKDLLGAVSRLERLGRTPLESVTRALVFAETQGYVSEDVERMRLLEAVLVAGSQGASAATPTGRAPGALTGETPASGAPSGATASPTSTATEVTPEVAP
jgi:hypothetical protein